MRYTEVTFTLFPYSEDVSDALIGELGTIGFDAFESTGDGFHAYIPTNNFEEEAIAKMALLVFFAPMYKVSWTFCEVEDKDWNKVWEDNFTPIVVKDRILVRAGFHPTIDGIDYEIIIEPKMSFGTGHHSTTALMLETILDCMPMLMGKRVLDMGCGTGILSIMAAKVGAAEVTGIDIDDWAFNNAMENIRNNSLENITIKIGDAALLEAECGFDVVLANINRNILLNDMCHYVARLNAGGMLIMSGFYTEDLPMIREEAERLGLKYVNYRTENNWVAASFSCCGMFV